MSKYYCERKDCYAFNEIRENNCECLSTLYEDNNECKFFKNKSEVSMKVLKQEAKMYANGRNGR